MSTSSRRRTARAVGLGVPGDQAVDDLVAGLGDSEVLLLLDEAEWALSASAIPCSRCLRDAGECSWW